MEKVAAILLLLLHLSSAQQQSSGSIGNSDETAGTASRAQLFYLDTANPATCTGNVTSWRVCYYGPDAINNTGSYWATYAVYQRIGSGNSVNYMRVSEMFRAIRTVTLFTGYPIVDGRIVEGGFNCYTDSGDSPLIIQTGDILGSCVFDPEDIVRRLGISIVTRLPLDVVGEASGETLLQMDTAGCSIDDIPSNISANQLSILNSRRLHIYANIECEPTTLTIQTVSIPATTTAAATTIASQTHPATTATATSAEVHGQTTEIDPFNESLIIITDLLTAILPSQVPNSVMEFETTESAPIPDARGGIQAAKAVGGIVGGCVLLLLLTVSSVTTCLILKRKGFTLSTNSSSKISVGKQQEVNIITEDNIAYNCKSVRAEVTHVPIDTALEVVYDNAELRSTDSMEENIMAYYESLTVDEISLRSNAAYHKSERALSRESDCDISDQYEYIY